VSTRTDFSAAEILALIEPDVEVEILVRVIDTAIDHADNDLGGAGMARRPGFARLAAELVGRAGLVAIHAPELSAGISTVIADRVHADDVIRFGELTPGRFDKISMARATSRPAGILTFTSPSASTRICSAARPPTLASAAWRAAALAPGLNWTISSPATCALRAATGAGSASTVTIGSSAPTSRR
jgi:hypothetical protein